VSLQRRIAESYFNKTGNVRVKVTMEHVRVTTVAVEQQYVLHIFIVSVALFIQHTRRMRRIIFSCSLYGSTNFFRIIS